MALLDIDTDCRVLFPARCERVQVRVAGSTLNAYDVNCRRNFNSNRTFWLRERRKNAVLSNLTCVMRLIELSGGFLTASWPWDDSDSPWHGAMWYSIVQAAQLSFILINGNKYGSSSSSSWLKQGSSFTLPLYSNCGWVFSFTLKGWNR